MGIILKEHRSCASEIFELELLDIAIVNKNLSLSGIVKTRNQLEDRTFATTIRTNDDLKE